MTIDYLYPFFYPDDIDANALTHPRESVPPPSPIALTCEMQVRVEHLLGTVVDGRLVTRRLSVTAARLRVDYSGTHTFPTVSKPTPTLPHLADPQPVHLCPVPQWLPENGVIYEHRVSLSGRQRSRVSLCTLGLPPTTRILCLVYLLRLNHAAGSCHSTLILVPSHPITSGCQLGLVRPASPATYVIQRGARQL